MKEAPVTGTRGAHLSGEARPHKRRNSSFSVSRAPDFNRLTRIFNAVLVFISVLLLTLLVIFLNDTSERRLTYAVASVSTLLMAGVICVIARRTAVWAGYFKDDLAAFKSRIFQDHKLITVGQLVGGVAHEINNPLAIIASEAGLIKDMLNPETGLENSPEAIIRELNEIEKATYRAKGITEKILSFVRKTEPQTVPCRVEQLLDDVVSEFVEQEFKVSDITVRRNYSGDIPPLMLDPNLMRQVYLNLINNARDAVREGGTITLRVFVDGCHVKITVADTGEGISEEEVSKVFMPFYTTKSPGRGTGLGLPISLKIIEEFGGTIEVESSQGQDTSFTISLPISKTKRDVKLDAGVSINSD